MLKTNVFRAFVFLAVAQLVSAASPAATPSGAFWNAAGPSGGVVLALAAFPSSPEVLYAGVDHGGVFRSDDAGVHWRSVSAGLSDLDVTSLAVSPADANVVVVGAFSAISVSRDGGATWAVASGSPGTPINAVVFDPADATIAYAVSSSGWAGRSVDGGGSWNPIAADTFVQQPTAFAVAPSAHTTLYLGTLQNGVYRSADSGATWTAKNNGLTNLHVSALGVDPENPQLVYAGTVNGGAFLSSDGGENWFPSGTFTAVNAIRVDSAGTAYLSDNVGVWALPRGTAAWAGVSPVQWSNAIALGTGSPQRLFVGYGKLPFSTGGVARLDGSTATVLIDGLTGITVGSLAVDAMDAETRILAGTVGDGLLQSQDGGHTWTRLTGLSQNSILDVVVVPGAPEAFYVAAAGGIFRSTDEGATWTSVSNGLPTSPPTPVASLLIPPGAGSAFLAGTYSGLFRSTDAAASWNQVTSGFPAQVVYALAPDPASNGVVYAATEQGVFRSTDGGATWSSQSSGITGGLVYDVAVSGGAVFAAGEGGVFRSSNTGASWDKLGGGLPSAASHAIVYDSSSSTLLAGTYAGVYESSDFGTTWTSVASGPPNSQILSLAVLPEGGVLVGTLGGSTYLLVAPNPREPVVRVAQPRVGTRTLPPRP